MCHAGPFTNAVRIEENHILIKSCSLVRRTKRLLHCSMTKRPFTKREDRRKQNVTKILVWKLIQSDVLENISRRASRATQFGSTIRERRAKQSISQTRGTKMKSAARAYRTKNICWRYTRYPGSLQGHSLLTPRELEGSLGG